MEEEEAGVSRWLRWGLAGRLVATQKNPPCLTENYLKYFNNEDN